MYKYKGVEKHYWDEKLNKKVIEYYDINRKLIKKEIIDLSKNNVKSKYKLPENP